MPCGGIYPLATPPAQTHIRSKFRVIYKHLPCEYCRKITPPVTHICVEWDCYLHNDCIDAFLTTPAGRIVLEHKHKIVR